MIFFIFWEFDINNLYVFSMIVKKEHDLIAIFDL